MCTKEEKRADCRAGSDELCCWVDHRDSTPAELGWFKSSYSGPNGCVEVTVGTGHISGHVIVRNSHRPDGPTLAFTAAEWTAFIQGVRAGEFNLPGEVES